MHLLKSIPIPYAQEDALDEIQYSGYTPLEMEGVVSVAVQGGQVAVSAGTCTFPPATGYVGPPIAGFAVTCIATDLSLVVVLIWPATGAPIDPAKVTGNYVIQWSIQRYVGP